ncbi:porin family protein [Flavobacteriaceae bacterium TK19130]|nr:porin family protein [Thermobacterium salinum]
MRTFLIALLALCAFQTSNAQIEEGNILVSLGVGLSPTFYSGNGYESSTPPIEVAGEYAFTEDITGGIFAGYASAEFRNSGFGYDYTYTLFGAVGNYHFVNEESFNVYAGAKLGYVSISSESVGTNNGFNFSAEASGLLYGGQLGARYWFSDAIAVNAELGYGVSIFKAGVSFKF